MTQNWQKLGHVFSTDGSKAWAQSFAYVPTPTITDGKIRIFYSALDRDEHGRISFIDCDLKHPENVIYVHPEPCLDLGQKETFDCDGVSPSCLVQLQDRWLLFYFGWQRFDNPRYRLVGGVAESFDKGLSFRRCFNEPIIPKSEFATDVRSAPFAIFSENAWKVWFVAGREWTQVGEKQVPSYGIAFANGSNVDGLSQQKLCITPNFSNDEFGLGRPFVMKEKDLWRMWYSVRSKKPGYRIGYAESNDGIKWARNDQSVQLLPSREGWDSECVCFSGLVKTSDNLYMYYNGNGLGRTGFGVAKLSESNARG